MKNRINNALNTAYGEMIPKDMYNRIEQSIESQNERTMILSMKSSKKRIIRYALSAVAALVFIFLGAFGGMYYTNNLMVDSIIDIDVNPSVEITANKKDRVLKAIAVNEDAEKILEGMDLKNADLDVAVNAVIGSMLKHGYLTTGENDGILVTVQNGDTEKAETVRTRVVSNINDTLKISQVSASVINQTVTKETEAEKFAEKHGISLGKATFILNLCKKDASLNKNKLAKMKLTEIVDIVNEKHLDVTDIVDYDSDDSLFENIADEVEDINEDKAEGNKDDSSIKTAKITLDDAKAFALYDAGVTSDQAVFTKSELDRDDGKSHYDIEFRANGIEYDYEINAENGNIINSDFDDDDDHYTSTPSVTSQDSSTTGITKKKARAVALSHAGVTANNAIFDRVEISNDDGVKHYEVEFRVGSTEYDYDINYYTGEVISSSIDRDDDNISSTTSTTAAKVLSKTKIKMLALKHANVDEADATFQKVELDRDDGVLQYEIEFKANGIEYDYTINASSGKVIEYEKDRDD